MFSQNMTELLSKDYMVCGVFFFAPLIHSFMCEIYIFFLVSIHFIWKSLKRNTHSDSYSHRNKCLTDLTGNRQLISLHIVDFIGDLSKCCFATKTVSGKRVWFKINKLKNISLVTSGYIEEWAIETGALSSMGVILHDYTIWKTKTKN